MIEKLAKYQHKMTFFKAIVCSITALVFLVAGYVIFEPNITKAIDDTVEVSLTVTGTISITSPSNVTMASIAGVGVGATSLCTWSVTTNNASGWNLTVQADTDPAMLGVGDTSLQFADYTEGTPGTPEAWSVASDAAEFGFSASGTYAVAGFSSGSNFMGFQGTTPIQIATDSSTASSVGTTLHLKAEIGTSKVQETSEYNATITASATTL